MTREDIIGTWRSTKKIENGKEKTIKNSKFTITFTGDGYGKMKILFIPLQFQWTFHNNMLTMANASDGTPLESQIEISENCMIMKEKGSLTYFAKD